MNSHSSTSSAFLMSAALHAAVVLVLLFTAYVFKTKPPETTRFFELVAGDGNNYLAKEAPALGDGGVKLSVPKMPAPPVQTAPAPVPVAPPETPKAEPAPLTPTAPVEKAPAPKPAPPKQPVVKKEPPSIATQLKQKLRAAQNKAKNEVKKEREDEQKRMTKEAFDKANAEKKVATSKAAASTVKKINAAGIKEGVTGGSPANTVGGARGNALVADDGSEAQLYEALLMQLLREQLDQIPGLEDGLKAEAELRVLVDGTLTQARIVKSSGNAVFDRAVLRAIAAVKMPSRPKGFQELVKIPFSTRAKD